MLRKKEKKSTILNASSPSLVNPTKNANNFTGGGGYQVALSRFVFGQYQQRSSLDMKDQFYRTIEIISRKNIHLVHTFFPQNRGLNNW